MMKMCGKDYENLQMKKVWANYAVVAWNITLLQDSPVCASTHQPAPPIGSNVNPFITALPSPRFKESGVEKMDLRWYHWVSRWAAMSRRFNGRGLLQSARRVQTLTPTDSETLAERKLSGSGFGPGSALNVKWAVGDEPRPPGEWGDGGSGTHDVAPGSFKLQITSVIIFWLKFSVLKKSLPRQFYFPI